MATSRSAKVAGAAAIAAAMAVPMEGLRQVVYRDPVGIPTVCYGTTGKAVIPGKFYTVPECTALLNMDMLKAAEEVDRCVPDAPPMVLAAFSDTAYNAGSKIACDTAHSTAARMLKAKNWVGACKELPKWAKARIAGVLVELPGLVRRRAAAMEICLSGFA